jgi:hypothetical protein
MANILELDPFAFAAALEELQLPEEDAARLREQYRQKQSVFAGAKEALKPEEGRNTSDILPVSVPEGMSIAEGVTSGDWDWAVPEGLTSGATAALEGFEAPGQIASGVPYSEQELQDAAWKTAGVAGAGSLTAPVPEGATRMFGGVQAKNFPQERANKATEMYWGDRPLDPDTIWEETGIELQGGGIRPVFQIDPKNALVADPAELKPSVERFFQKYPNQTDAVYDVEQILDFPELYENYPELKTFDVVFKNNLEEGQYGWMDITNRELVLNTKLLDNPEELRATLLHEMQHGIQAKEGISGGANTQYFFRNKNPDVALDDYQNWSEKVEGRTEELRNAAQIINNQIDWATSRWDSLNEEDQFAIINWVMDAKRESADLAFKKYLTNDGEIEARAAELWDNLSTEEKRTTKPSDMHKQALRLLKKEYGDTYVPTARFAAGGMVEGTNMEDNMTKLFAEGGVNTGNAEVDPVSGNEVPPGSLPEEVRDDVDAKLSGGEYVVPADVLRFYGVSFFEKLRKKAKEGLAEMDAEGRIGGDSAPEEGMTEGPEMEEDDDLPFGEDELMYEEDDMEFAQGGVVPPGGIKTFDPNQFYAGFSVFNPAGQPAATTTPPATGTPTTPQAAAAAPVQPPKQESWADKQLGGAPSANNSLTRQNADSTPDWGAGKDWKTMTAQEASNLANSRLEGNKIMQAGAQIAGAVNPLLGLAAGAAVNLRPFAEANGLEKALRASGNIEAADAVAKLVDERLAESKLGIRTLEPMLANGSRVAKSLLKGAGGTPTKQNAVVKGGESASGKTFNKAPTESWADKQSTGGMKDRNKMTTQGSAGTTTTSGGSSKGTKTTKKATGGLIERRKK